MCATLIFPGEERPCVHCSCQEEEGELEPSNSQQQPITRLITAGKEDSYQLIADKIWWTLVYSPIRTKNSAVDIKPPACALFHLLPVEKACS